MVTARQAQLRFNDKDYVEAMVTVNQAILAASPNCHRVCVDIPTGPNNTGLQVKYQLERVGFKVMLCHDSDNGSTEITVEW